MDDIKKQKALHALQVICNMMPNQLTSAGTDRLQDFLTGNSRLQYFCETGDDYDWIFYFILYKSFLTESTKLCFVITSPDMSAKIKAKTRFKELLQMFCTKYGFDEQGFCQWNESVGNCTLIFNRLTKSSFVGFRMDHIFIIDCGNIRNSSLKLIPTILLPYIASDRSGESKICLLFK